MTMQSETIGKLAEALAKAQAVIENPAKNREVEVRMKTGGSYKFSYTTLDEILRTVRDPLTSNGLWFVQGLALSDDGKYRLMTRLLHSSGEWIESETPLFVGEQSNQAFGSAVTYAKRYALSAMLGIAADEDDDANSADGHGVTGKADKPGKETPKQNFADQTPSAAKDPPQSSGKKRLAGFFERPSYTIAWPESTDKKSLTIEEQCASWLGHWTAVIDKLDTADEWMKLSVDNADMLQMLKRGAEKMHAAAVKAHKEAGKEFDPNRIPLVGG